MIDAHENAEAAASEGVGPTVADAVANPAMAPMDDDAGGPTAGKERLDEPSDEEAAAQLGELS